MTEPGEGVPEPSLYRMWLKTTGDRAEVLQACLEGGFLGVGWGYRWDKRVRPPRRITWQRYMDFALSQWDNAALSSVRLLHDADDDGLVWTRTADGIFYLAQFTGPWEYRRGKVHDELDLNNVRPAEIIQIGTENEVPGAVVRRFSAPGRTFSRVHSVPAARYSALLWSQKTRQRYPWRPSLAEVLSEMLSPLDVQDLVAAYLQSERGWLLFPSRLSDGTAHYEYVLRDPASGRSYAVQVKTGGQTIHQPDYRKAADIDGWVLFSTEGRYTGRRPSHAEQLDTAELARFLTTRASALPPIAARWMDVVDDASHTRA